MKALGRSWLVVGVLLCATVPTGAQPPAGALAVDERQGDQYGWAVDYETPAAARPAALSECGAGCSVVLTFNPVRGVCGRPGRRQHGGGLGGVVTPRRMAPVRLRWVGRGGAGSRPGCSSSRSRRASRPAAPTGCSVRRRARRFVAGSRHEVVGRPAYLDAVQVEALHSSTPARCSSSRTCRCGACRRRPSTCMATSTISPRRPSVTATSRSSGPATRPCGSTRVLAGV